MRITPHNPTPLLAAWALLVVGMAFTSVSAQSSAPPAPPGNLQAKDHPWDDGTAIDLEWTPSSDHANLKSYQILKGVSRVGGVAIEPQFTLIEPLPVTKDSKTKYTATDLRPEVSKWDLEKSYGKQLNAKALLESGEKHFPLEYVFQVIAVSKDDQKSAPAQTAPGIAATMEIFDGGRAWLALITVILCGSVVAYIFLARRGMPMRVRKIAGLEAVDEAVGRATEMGRSCLFVTGTQDMNDIQTVAGITILARVAKTAAEYDAKVEVPTSRSLVMTTARETVQAAFLAAGRPDAYNEDMIYYVTDEQFGFVAYLQGTMVRDKPAACFYMGAFFAESLILAETGNSIGAIQIAGTAQPAQLPFFVAACDYTLIGEEFFAASAYLSGEPDQLGSLKGQDVGKLIVALILIVGCALATIATITDNQAVIEIVNYLKGTMLT